MQPVGFRGSVKPQERLKHLIDFTNAVEVDFHIPPTRYYRSGLEMVRMANVYHNEGNLENAYVLYLKFMTLFLEKIRKHPDFNTVPVQMKAINQAKLREVLPKAEKLKEELLNQYKAEYKRHLGERERRKPREAAKSERLSDLPSASNKFDEYVDVNCPQSISDVIYPDLDADSPGKTHDSVEYVMPEVDRKSKPSVVDLCGRALRAVIVPGDVMKQFQLKAQKNTINNVETCGILAGQLARDELTITHMILPKQKGTADSCTTMNEEEIFDFQDQHSLITIGWIHTHPTQTAFLSSVDLHTHCPYQLLMPEAIAVVCAPRYNETAFFVLTPDYGLKFIANCRKSGFHPHPTNPPLFMVAEHVKIEQEASLEVLDLRTDKS